LRRRVHFGRGGLREIPRRPADVALMDINLPGMSGVECTYRLKKLSPATQVMILTAYTDNEKIFKALAMGAGGYLLKRTPPDQILSAIADIHQGGAPMSGYIARKVVSIFRLAHGAQYAGPLAPRRGSAGAGGQGLREQGNRRFAGDWASRPSAAILSPYITSCMCGHELKPP